MTASALLCAGLLTVGCQKHKPKLASIELYSGYVSTEGGVLYGRVSKGPPDPHPEPNQSKIVRALETLEALDASALPYASVEVSCDGHPLPAISDDRGYLQVQLPSGIKGPKSAVSVTLRQTGFSADSVQTEVPVYDGNPGLAVLSDVDDTVLDSQITDRKKMIENALLRSTWELKTFPGAPEALTRLSQGKPVFYLSGSPWGFHRRIYSYFQRTGFPSGTLILKRFSKDPLLDQMAFKYPHLKAVADALPNKKFLLFGDSGEKDPEIYARFRSEFPSRVEQIFIHLVTAEPTDSSRFTGMRVFKNWTEL